MLYLPYLHGHIYIILKNYFMFFTLLFHYIYSNCHFMPTNILMQLLIPFEHHFILYYNVIHYIYLIFSKIPKMFHIIFHRNYVMPILHLFIRYIDLIFFNSIYLLIVWLSLIHDRLICFFIFIIDYLSIIFLTLILFLYHHFFILFIFISFIFIDSHCIFLIFIIFSFLFIHYHIRLLINIHYHYHIIYMKS